LELLRCLSYSIAGSQQARGLETNSNSEHEADFPVKKRHFSQLKENHQPMISINYTVVSLSASLTCCCQNFSDYIAVVINNKFV
jgi:hypothetical protein